MKLNKIYWLFIGAGVLAHTVATVLTWYALTFLYSYECNPIMDYSFNTNGFIITGVVSNLIIMGAFIIIPYLFKENETPGLISIFFEFVFVIMLALDCFHDIFVVSDNNLGYITGYILKTMVVAVGAPYSC